ncbi:MAG: transglutaminase, partial [Deltaproteobacteria bacterium]|nr:transglutaminase [Deltaproteobacteria bacterium]
KPPKERSRVWPQSPKLDAIPANLPAAHEKTPEAVGRYIASQTTDAFERARAVHDYVADRIAYDAVALANHRYPPYDPPTVLKRRLAVCAGYAKLFVAIAKAAGLQAIYLTGHARQKDGSIDGIGHAWNGVRIAGRWYLLDATWDSGSVNGTTFTKHLRTTYFLTPPKIFGVDHFPDDSRWQLRKKPMTRGQFIRQPFMKGSFYAAGLRLLAPLRPQVSVGRQLQVRLELPSGTYALVSPQKEGQILKRAPKCGQSSRGVFDCRFPSAGRYTVHICIAHKEYGSYNCVGKVLVNSDA